MKMDTIGGYASLLLGAAFLAWVPSTGQFGRLSQQQWRSFTELQHRRTMQQHVRFMQMIFRAAAVGFLGIALAGLLTSIA